MKTVGLTGIIGAGKSSVIQILKELGITVLDCDAINAQLLQKKQAGYCGLVSLFTADILTSDGQIDKQKMSDQIFSNPQKKQQVEAILHPLIKQRIDEELTKHKHEALVVVEVPLLFEIGWETYFDQVWVVVADEQVIMHRLIHSRHMNASEVKRRMATQMPQDVKIRKADRVIRNDGDVKMLKEKIMLFIKE